MAARTRRRRAVALRARWLEEPSAERASEAGLDAVYERWAFPDAWLVRPEGVYSMRMARAGGATVLTGTEVTGISSGGGTVTGVRTPHGDLYTRSA